MEGRAAQGPQGTRRLVWRRPPLPPLPGVTLGDAERNRTEAPLLAGRGLGFGKTEPSTEGQQRKAQVLRTARVLSGERNTQVCGSEPGGAADTCGPEPLGGRVVPGFTGLCLCTVLGENLCSLFVSSFSYLISRERETILFLPSSPSISFQLWETGVRQGSRDGGGWRGQEAVG